MLNIATQNFLNNHLNNKNISSINLKTILPDCTSYFKKETAINDFHILQEISYKCSANCPYCMNKGLDYSEPELPVEEYINFYEKLIKENNAKIKLKISGGEPTQPNVIHRTNQLMEYAIKNPNIYAIQINTNGYWPIPIEWKSDKVKIQFSLDGEPEYMEQTTGLKNIYNHILENIQFCKNNEISCHIRSVIFNNDLKIIPFLKKISEQLNILVMINLAAPVGGAKDCNEKEQLLSNIKTLMEFKQKHETPLCKMRFLIGRCPKVFTHNNFNMVITPSGRIGLCAFLQTVLNDKINLTIYSFNNAAQHKIEIGTILKDKTCCYPNGFLNFWNSLNIDEKKSLIQYLTYESDSDILNIKDFYSLEV